MTTLNTLSNTREEKKRKRVGRGPRSGMGKTSGRGHKGQGARSGYKKRHGTEGGQLPLYRKLPCRGFTRGRFVKTIDIVNLWQIDKFFQDGEEVNVETLRKHGLVSAKCDGVKLLANGEITKKITVNLENISKGAIAQLEKAGITVEKK